MPAEKLYEIWSKRNPKWETRYEDALLRKFTDYGVGASELTFAKGKALGAGYELFIYAFFIGLYADKKRELVGDTKTFGQPIQFWGNLDSKKFRKAYPRLREYIFIALIARTKELDLIALEEGKLKDVQAVDLLKDTMEQYANYGFYIIEEKLQVNPSFFYTSTGFLDLILDLVLSNPIGNKEEIEEL